MAAMRWWDNAQDGRPGQLIDERFMGDYVREVVLVSLRPGCRRVPMVARVYEDGRVTLDDLGFTHAFKEVIDGPQC